MRAKHDRVEAVDADLLWSAAQAAYRINGGYLKVPKIEGSKIVKPTNREIVTVALHDQNLITDADRKQAKKCRSYMAQSATMSALKDQLNEWGEISGKVCAKDTIDSNYDIAIITAMPHSYARSVKREEVDARLARCNPILNEVGEKVELSGEVVRSGYSARFGTWFISVITERNENVWFGYREGLIVDSSITFRGTVKRHSNSSTQLNRVKVEGDLK
jgi:hypothetical protein